MKYLFYNNQSLEINKNKIEPLSSPTLIIIQKYWYEWVYHGPLSCYSRPNNIHWTLENVQLDNSRNGNIVRLTGTSDNQQKKRSERQLFESKLLRKDFLTCTSALFALFILSIIWCIKKKYQHAYKWILYMSAINIITLFKFWLSFF